MRKSENSTKCSTRVLLSLLLLVLLLAQQAWAGIHWFSTTHEERKPLTLQVLEMEASASSSGGEVFDVVISLHNDPTGDNDRTTNDDRTPLKR